MHRRANTVSVAQVNVVPHSYFVPIVKNGCAGEREQQTVEQFDAPAIIVNQRSQTPADAQVDAHSGVCAIGDIHIVAFVFGDHLECQFVVISQEKSPLASVRNRGGLRDNVSDRQPVFLPQGHIDSRHQWKMKGHVALVAVAEVRADVGRPLVGFGQERAGRIMGVNFASKGLYHGMSFGEIFAAGSLSLHQVGNGIHAQSVHSHIQPVAHHLQNFLDDSRIVEV